MFTILIVIWKQLDEFLLKFDNLESYLLLISIIMLGCDGSNYQFTVSFHSVLFCFLDLSLVLFVFVSYFLA